MTISILLVDDHVLFREGVRALLEATTEFRIDGEAGDGMQALALAERLRPNVMVLDYRLPGMSGLEVMRSLHKNLPETRVVILSLHDEEFYVLKTIMNGASGYILKEDVSAHLALAITAAAGGRFYFSPILWERIVLSELSYPTGRVQFFDAVTSQILDPRVNNSLPGLSTAMTQSIFPRSGGNLKSTRNH